MPKAKEWISAFRLRTLFLAMAAVVMGSGLALHKGSFSTTIFFLAFLLSVSIQILSNLANDLGDFQKGADTTGRRQGPTRAVQSGKISTGEMKRAIAIFSVICIITGLLLVMNIMVYIHWSAAVILIALGGASILSAIFYTLGKHAYGYKGWGDLFAFIFFGPVPVIGVYYFHTHSLDFLPVLPAVGLGLISTMTLNINNIRDIENDKASGKITLAVKLGAGNAKVYHTTLTVASLFCFILYNRLYGLYESSTWYSDIYVIVFLFLFKINYDVYRKSGKALDPCLKLTSFSGFLLALLFSICINI